MSKATKLKPVDTYANSPKAPGFMATFLKTEEGAYFFQIVRTVLDSGPALVGPPIGPFGDLGAAIDAARNWRPKAPTNP